MRSGSLCAGQPEPAAKTRDPFEPVAPSYRAGSAAIFGSLNQPASGGPG